MTPAPRNNSSNYIDIYVTLNDPSGIYINKKISVEIYEILSNGKVGQKLETKVITDKAYKDIPYRLYIDKINSGPLDSGKKYYIKPVLTTNDKNPVYYIVAPRIVSPLITLNFIITMFSASCYNIPEARFCNIPQCAWTNKNICYKKEDQTETSDPSEQINLRNYCPSIKDAKICSLNDICTWENKCVSKLQSPIVPSLIPTSTVSSPTVSTTSPPEPTLSYNPECVF